MLTKSLPLYEELEAEGATSTDMARCVGRCVSLSISNEQNNDTCRLFFDVSCEIEGEFYRNEASSVTKDCYSTKYESQSSFKSIDTYSLVSAKNHSFSINDKFKKKDSSVESVVSALCEITGEKTELKNGKLMLSGKIQAAVIGKTAETEAKNSEYVSEIYEIPFRYDIPCEDGDIISRISYDAVISSARYEGDKFNISLEVYPSVSIFKRTAEEILDACVIKKDKEYKNDPSCVRVFFPKDCDILWEVAKKYHTTQRKIVEDNELPSYSLENVKSIII